MENIAQNGNSMILLTEAGENQPQTILKVLNIEAPTPHQVKQFYNEWSIIQNIEIPGIRNILGKTTYHGKEALILEYIDGQCLSEVFFGYDVELDLFLKVAIQISTILGEIHQEKIIHKDICPDNILLESKTGEVKIIDFGLATSLNLKTSFLGNPSQLQGSLHFMSPEQTGRMNRTLDYRSDLYSLGATLYKLLCGQLPFELDDPLELVHNHLAVKPISIINQLPEKLRSDNIYIALDQIILKLLSKNAEDRYQSAYGLKADLEKCFDAYKNKASLEYFVAGQNDFSDKFLIPQKLYGREEEVKFLFDVYQQASKGESQILLVSGYSGVGKSALIYEVHKPLTRNKGYFIEGKFDQFQRNIPYYAWIQAFENFVQLLLTENPATLEKWKTHFLHAFNGQGRLLTDLIPSLAKIVGPQVELPVLTPKENQNRFNIVFENFIKTIAQPDHPLFIFIDDWQWADSSSLNLLEKIMIHSDVEYLLVSGAFRDNEVDEDHPFAFTMKRLNEGDKTPFHIRLENLHLHHINQLVADTLKCPSNIAQPMSQLLHSKTNGNAFFLRQMLQSLYENEAIQLKYDTRAGMLWDWDIQQITSLQITDNVVELMVEKAKKLPKDTRKVLELASCIGTLFPLTTLSIIYQKSSQDTYLDLKLALEHRLVLPAGDHYTFSHDRIQQAVYSLIPQKEKENFHFRIGQLMLKHFSSNKHEQAAERVFDLVNQLNYGLKLITDESDILEIVRLNLQAGIQSKQSIAYDAALYYLKVARSLLPKDSWGENYQLTYSVYRHLAETHVILFDFEDSEVILDIAFENANSVVDKLEILDLQIWKSQLTVKGEESIIMMKKTLVLCNIQIPTSEEKVLEAIISLDKEIEAHLQEEGLDAFKKATRISDHMTIIQQKVISRLVFLLGHSEGRSHFYEWIVHVVVLQCLNMGITGNVLPVLAHYCSLLNYKGAYDKGYRLSEILIEMSQDYPDFHLKVSLLHRIGLWSYIFGKGLLEIIPIFEEAWRIGKETGNFVDVGICGYDIILHKSRQGLPINEVLEELNKVEEYVIKMDFHHLLIYILLEKFLLNSLIVSDDHYLIKDTFDQDVDLEFTSPNVNIGWLAHCMLAQKFWMDDLHGVVDTFYKYQPYFKNCASNIIWADHFFYLGLTIATLFNELNDQEKYKNLLDECRQRMEGMAKVCPVNFSHKMWLLEAVIIRKDAQDWSPASYYQKAISEAKKYKFNYIEGLAHKLCAIFWHDVNQPDYARLHFKQSHQCYTRWEASGIADKLQLDFPEYFDLIKENTNVTSSTSSALQLDLESLLKASQVISGEIVLSNLISKLIPIVIENAGAEKGSIISFSNNQPVHLARGRVGDEVVTFTADKASKKLDLPLEILYYVAQSGEPLVLENAYEASVFAHDFYIQSVKPKSVLCFPIYIKDELSHLIYLENNLTTGAFTQKRVKILQSLSSQIGISIENARLYENQEKTREAYSKFVPHAFLNVLGHDNILDIQLGDQVQKEVTVLFADIRSYTSLSESMNPAENFNFLNAFLSRMVPSVTQNNGFINSYYGDGIMALFLHEPEDALKASLDMQQKISEYNKVRSIKQREPIKIGIGIHTGKLILGILGDRDHQQASVVSDAVNTAARLEGLTKYFQASIIISQEVLGKIDNPDQYQHRFLGKVRVKGKSTIVSIHEVFDSNQSELIELKQKANPSFQNGLSAYFKKDFIMAVTHFKNALTLHPEAPVIHRYFQNAARLIVNPPHDEWVGAEVMDEK